jgi:SAM-dependent methyltransferase
LTAMARIRRVAAWMLFQSGKTAERLARLSHYMAVGTLSLSEMRADIRDGWNDFYSSDPAPAPLLLDWEDQLAKRFLPSGSAVLVVGGGGGRDLVGLAERGCTVTSVEPSETAIQHARRVLAERHLAATLISGFFEDAVIPGTFDAVIFSYHCYAFIPGAARRTEALRKAAGLLNPGGHILVSHASRIGKPHPVLVTLGRLVATVCHSDWRLEPGDVVWENRRGQPTYSYTHAFAPGELEREASAANLTLVFQKDTNTGSLVAAMRRR